MSLYVNIYMIGMLVIINLMQWYLRNFESSDIGNNHMLHMRKQTKQKPQI